MKLAGKVSKSVVLVLAGAAIVWFFADLLSMPTSGSLLEKLIFTKPVVLAIRISLIVVAFGVVGFVVLAFWKGIGIRKIGSEGIEFEEVDEGSKKMQSDLTAKDAKIKELERTNGALQKEIDELQEFSKSLIAMRGGES